MYKKNVAIVIKRLLRKHGFAKNSTKAIIANAFGESSLNPFAVQPNSVGRGLWQWSLYSNISSMKVNDIFSATPQQSIKMQVTYLIDNPKQWIYNGYSDYPMTWNEFKNNSQKLSARQLTIAFMEQWERPALNTFQAGEDRWKNYAKIEHQSLELIKG